MLHIVLWALATGFVTGAVWLAIVLYRRPPHGGEPPILPESQPAESLTLENMTRRLLDVEERLDATEHRLRRDKVDQPRRPPL